MRPLKEITKLIDGLEEDTEGLSTFSKEFWKGFLDGLKTATDATSASDIDRLYFKVSKMLRDIATDRRSERDDRARTYLIGERNAYAWVLEYEVNPIKDGGRGISPDTKRKHDI